MDGATVVMYTQPFDTVIDPFAGGGATIDAATRFRTLLGRQRSGRRLTNGRARFGVDLTHGLPQPPRWQDVKLTFLDPPYWRQAQNEYSKDKEDLANMSLEEFTRTLAGIINDHEEALVAEPPSR